MIESPTLSEALIIGTLTAFVLVTIPLLAALGSVH